MSNYPYKARNCYTGDWVYGYYVHLDSGKICSDRIYKRFSVLDSCDNFYADWYEVQPGSICRCTDFVDCIGSSIYEHDIISFLDEFGRDCKTSVEYYNGCFVVFLDNKEFLLRDIVSSSKNNVTIIGNRCDENN